MAGLEGWTYDSPVYVGYSGEPGLTGVAYTGESRLASVAYTEESRLPGVAYSSDFCGNKIVVESYV